MMVTLTNKKIVSLLQIYRVQFALSPIYAPQFLFIWLRITDPHRSPTRFNRNSGSTIIFNSVTKAQLVRYLTPWRRWYWAQTHFLKTTEKSVMWIAGILCYPLPTFSPTRPSQTHFYLRTSFHPIEIVLSLRLSGDDFIGHQKYV